ncbi:MAG: nitroreductase [Flavobacteriales bacterium]|nr:MAG: nitroreductase [Flavobacteriales bacterium]PIE49672.1 MAG: nitroreductase [Flavobacteriales bacterium]
MEDIRETRLHNIATPDYQIYPLLEQRYSPRTFMDKEISDEDLKVLFEAVRWAASSNNYQPWRFIVAKKGTVAYKKLVSCLSEFNQKWVENAPVLCLCGFKKTFDNGKENFHALYDLGLSLGNMSVQAQDMNIALHHMGGVNWKKAHEEFNVPDDFHIATALAMGYYGGNLDKLPKDLQEQEQSIRIRNPQKDFVYYDNWKINHIL